jgi:hypothetical protein
MRIDILFFRGCPNHMPTVSLVQEVVRDLGIQAIVQEVEVKEPTDAMRLRFLGSPTVQVEGRDIEPERWDDRQYALSCRMYGASGIPSRELVASALTNTL